MVAAAFRWAGGHAPSAAGKVLRPDPTRRQRDEVIRPQRAAPARRPRETARCIRDRTWKLRDVEQRAEGVPRRRTAEGSRHAYEPGDEQTRSMTRRMFVLVATQRVDLCQIEIDDDAARARPSPGLDRRFSKLSGAPHRPVTWTCSQMVTPADAAANARPHRETSGTRDASPTRDLDAKRYRS